jgi:S-adenosylmethionine:tRNA ribosyltransferase-isomerase
MAKIVERKENFVIVDFSWSPETLFFSEVLEGLGVMPIPPYLKRESDSNDNDRYQTVYAQQKGSVAAPTAGLHFTDRTFDELKKKSIQRINVTLHVGAGTFKPVKSDTMLAHEMHSEWMEVDLKTIQQLAMSHDQTIIAVGTTSLRTIESLYWMGFKAMRNPESSADELEIKQWDAYAPEHAQTTVLAAFDALIEWMEANAQDRIVAKTQLMIAPGYRVRTIRALVTNFHQPNSTLLLLVAALVGDDWRRIYQYALDHDFRFLSYGDGSLLFNT